MMDHLEHPTQLMWEARRSWFESQEEGYRGEAGYLISEQACALIADVQAAFCAGAWLAVVVLAMAVIDAQLQETELPGFKGNTMQLLDESGASPDVQSLRRRGMHWFTWMPRIRQLRWIASGLEENSSKPVRVRLFS
jgi:hypothetical protein